MWLRFDGMDIDGAACPKYPAMESPMVQLLFQPSGSLDTPAVKSTVVLSGSPLALV